MSTGLLRCDVILVRHCSHSYFFHPLCINNVLSGAERSQIYPQNVLSLRTNKHIIPRRVISHNAQRVRCLGVEMKVIRRCGILQTTTTVPRVARTQHILRLLDASALPWLVLFLARFVVDLYHHRAISRIEP